MTSPKALQAASISALPQYVDSLIIITPDLALLPEEFKESVLATAQHDKRIGQKTLLLVNEEAPGKTLNLGTNRANKSRTMMMCVAILMQQNKALLKHFRLGQKTLLF